MYRWTLRGTDERGKTDPDVHDHPWPFITFVLRGSYDDMVACPWHHSPQGACEPAYEWAKGCGGSGLIVGERMRAGMVRRRAAEHIHRTRTHERGAWTLVITGKKVREWGFWRDRKWWPFKLYERTFGFVMRCTDRETNPR